MKILNVEAVSAILKEGTQVSAKLGGSISWCGNVVYKSEGRVLYIALTDRFLQEGIAPGRPVSVKYINEYFIYAFEGAVIRINQEYPGYAVLNMTSAEEILNSRLSPRYDVLLEAGLKPVWDSEAYPATVTDISYGGIAFICGKPLDYNEELEIDINLHENRSIKARGKIIRKSMKSKAAEYSMQFSNMDESSYKILSHYFSHLEEEARRMYELYLIEIKQKNHEFKY